MFGIWNNKNAVNLTYLALHSMQHRGQEGAGIVSSDRNRIKGYRNIGLLNEVFKNRNVLENLTGDCALGSVWYSSHDTNNIQNIEPLLFKFYDEHIGISFSGNILNAKSLRKKLEEEGAVFHSSSNAELIVHLIRRSLKKEFEERLKEALLKLKGAFSIIILLNNAMYGIVDKHSRRPLVLGKLNNSLMIASETCALNVIGAKFVDNISAGQIFKITDEGYEKCNFTKAEEITIEAMEFIYFARPDSTILGKNVHMVRKNSGKILAKESPVDADIVVGVPNSSLSLASGYAEEIDLPYEMGLIKNQYMGRTFIQPTQDLRDLGVKMKLSALSDVVKDKRVVLLDDSIVRGTTSRRIVDLLKDAGAKEVHLRIGSPMILFPSYTGIDMQSSKNLIGANKSKEEICKEIGADSLEYLTLEGLQKAVGFELDSKFNGITSDIFNGQYTDDLCDYEKIFNEELTEIEKVFLNQGRLK
ncbi:amidophosphoribosyltransferase [Helcococcus ovis]|uniref:amidophosphoribosyltransferase n=1 Tax=Helcococcus ovis TaxID=72026 RepID=UPI0010702B18|nr:amidophosphoribosyltransferase [Helcococcus ovis]TFF66113.1 amidophosphoribosyltransferase [Helcococcus ovis]WNZ01740.1 amidophosphoribosyltransferase [Helcococcus ovis]